jgi:hypothetical protein
LHPGIGLFDQDAARDDFVFQEASTTRKKHPALLDRYLNEALGVSVMVVERIKTKKPEVFYEFAKVNICNKFRVPQRVGSQFAGGTNVKRFKDRVNADALSALEGK